MKKKPNTLPQADPLDTMERRKRHLINSLPTTTRQLLLEKLPEFQQPTPFELASLAAVMPANDSTQKRVLDAYELWEQSCEFLAPKKPPVASLDEVLRCALPKKSKSHRMDILMQLLESNVYSEKQKKSLKKKEREFLEKATADKLIQSYSANGVEYPQDLAEKLVNFAEAEAKKSRIARARQGGRGKAGKQQDVANPQKTKKELVGDNLPTSKVLPQPSSGLKQASKKWISRKLPYKAR
jgi:hypothetical protein